MLPSLKSYVTGLVSKSKDAVQIDASNPNLVGLDNFFQKKGREQLASVKKEADEHVASLKAVLADLKKAAGVGEGEEAKVIKTLIEGDMNIAAGARKVSAETCLTHLHAIPR